MRPPSDRDQQTVAIGTALAEFVLVVAAAVLGLWLLHFALPVADDLTEAILGTAIVIAGVLALSNLVRAQKK